MINLTPPAAKKVVIREYWLRVVTVWAILIGTAILVASSTLIPVWLYLNTQTTALADLVSGSAGKTQTYTTATAELTKANTQARLLLNQKPSYRLSTEAARLQAITSGDILLTEIKLQQSGTPVLLVTGVAATRVALAQYQRKLETEPSYIVVDLPLSSLIKDVEVPFSLTITLASTTPAL
jgi:hypothetical protein